VFRRLKYKGYRAMSNEEELSRCAESFDYFCRYLRVYTPVNGVVPLELYPFQRRLIDMYEHERFVIGIKFRQGGFSTITVLYGLWKTMFHPDQRFFFGCKTDREAIHLGKIVDQTLAYLPDWLVPKLAVNNKNKKTFSETGSFMMFHCVAAGRGVSLTHLVIDEAAFIPNMEDHWKCIYPTIATGGKCFVLSTTNGVGNWFYDTYTAASKMQNSFEVFSDGYWEHPKYQDPAVLQELRKVLGEKGFMQEIEGQFVVEDDESTTFLDLPELTDELLHIMHRKNLKKRERAAILEAICWLKHPPKN
jgi:hypothetical protein